MTRRSRREMAEAQARLKLKVRADIAKHGWSDIGVFPVPDKPGLSFNYTVGLTELGHPELLVQGLRNETMHQMLASAVKAIQGGSRFHANTYSTEVLEGLPVAFVAVPDLLNEDFPLTTAYELYGNITALHMVWPDESGRFPWQPLFNDKFRAGQVLASPWKGEA